MHRVADAEYSQVLLYEAVSREQSLVWDLLYRCLKYELYNWGDSKSRDLVPNRSHCPEPFPIHRLQNKVFMESEKCISCIIKSIRGVGYILRQAVGR